jgi:hypothetical protein
MALALYYPIKQSDVDIVPHGRGSNRWSRAMQVAIGKGIEMDVDVARFNNEVRDFVMRTGLRNLLMDSHATATAKAYPDDYLKRSRDMAEKKLANLYAGVTRAQSAAGPKAPTDPVAMAILRLARKAVASRPEIAKAEKKDRLATINRLANEYAKEHDAQLRPRAEKIVAIENGDPIPAPVQATKVPVQTAAKKKRAA